MTAEAEGEVLVLRHDGPGERAVARLRFGAAMAVIVAGAMLWQFDLGGVANAAVGLAGLAALGWLFVVRRSLRRLPDQERWSLTCAGTELILLQEETQRIPWANIDRIDADEERLVVSVQAEGTSLQLSPVWCGDNGRLGLHELATLLEAQRQRALSASEG